MRLPITFGNPGKLCNVFPNTWCSDCQGTGRVIYRKFKNELEYINCYVCGGSGIFEDAVRRGVYNTRW